jgi:hypothetical protein
MMLRRLSLLCSLLMLATVAPAQIRLIAAYAADHQYESLRVSLDGKRLYGEERSWLGQELDGRTDQMVDETVGPVPALSLEDNEYVSGEAELRVLDIGWNTVKRSFTTGLGVGEVFAMISESKNRIFVARPKSGNFVAYDANGNYLKYLRRNGGTTIPMVSPAHPFKNEKADQVIIGRSVFGMTSLTFLGDLPGTLLSKSNDGRQYLCRSDVGDLLLVQASNLQTTWSRPLRNESGLGNPINFQDAQFVEHDEFILVLSREYMESGAARTALIRFDQDGTQMASPFYAFPISDERARFVTNPVSRRVYVTLPTTRFPEQPMRLTILSYGPGGAIVKPYRTQITGRCELTSPGRNRSEFEVAGRRAIDAITGRDIERPMAGEGEIAGDSRNKVNRAGQFLEFTNMTSGFKYSYEVPLPAYTRLPVGVIDSFTAIWPVGMRNGFDLDRMEVYRTDFAKTRDLGSVMGSSVVAPGNFGRFATQDGTKINVYSYGNHLASLGSTPPISNLMWATLTSANRLTVIAAHRGTEPIGTYDLYRYVYQIDSVGVTEISRQYLGEIFTYPRVALSADGTRVAIYGIDPQDRGAVVLFNAVSGAPMASFSTGLYNGANSLVLVGNNRLVVKTNSDTTLLLELPN